jgi:hypothetical protein
VFRRVSAGYNRMGNNRKAVLDDDRPVTRGDLEETKLELKEAISHAIKEAADSLTELVGDTETKLLTAFHGYAKGTAARL